MISEDKRFQVEQAAGPIEFGRMQTIATVLKAAKLSKLTIDDILDYVDTVQMEKKASIETVVKKQRELIENIAKKSPQCPECGTILHIAPIDYDNDNNYKSRWFCPKGFDSDAPEGLCGYEKLNLETIEESYVKYGIIKEEKNANTKFTK